MELQSGVRQRVLICFPGGGGVVRGGCLINFEKNLSVSDTDEQINTRRLFLSRWRANVVPIRLKIMLYGTRKVVVRRKTAIYLIELRARSPRVYAEDIQNGRAYIMNHARFVTLPGGGVPFPK